MTKLLSALVTATFAVASLSPVAFAGDKTNRGRGLQRQKGR